MGVRVAHFRWTQPLPHPGPCDRTLLMVFLRSLLIEDRWLLLRRGLLISIWLALATLTHIPVPQMVQEMRVSDKLMHLVAYFPLGFLLTISRVPGFRSGRACLLVIAAYGILDELLQIPVGRTASVFDWIADVIGAATGIVVAQRLGTSKSVP